ncbi:MAG: hypothetical protein AAGB31_16725, partial [Bdellovibrio sp.]
FMTELERNQALMQEVAQSLETLATAAIDKENLKKIAQSGLLPEQLAQKAGLIEKITDSITLKQLVFFSFLNEVMTPKLRAAMMKDLEKSPYMGPIELRIKARQYGALMLKEASVWKDKIEKALGDLQNSKSR